MFGKIGIPEILILLVLLVLFTVAVYAVGKKVGYGKALRDVAEGKFPNLTDRKS